MIAAQPVVALLDDRLHAAVGQFGLAGQRLRLGADLGRRAALGLDLGADRGETGLGFGARRQLLDRLDGVSCAASTSSRSSARRLCASVSADLRAA